MGTRIIDKLVMMAVVIVLSLALAIPASAKGGDKVTVEETDFLTVALDANGDYKVVDCSKAVQTTDKNGKIKENYNCMFVYHDSFGNAELPAMKMKWDYASSDGLEDDTIDGLEGPYRWFSDIEDILSGDLCWMYSNNWRMELKPSGEVKIKVEYIPPYVIEGPDCVTTCVPALP